MPYVNIPVPEEHVEEVMQFVVRMLQRVAMEPWDESSINSFFGEVDESTRALLAFVARASLEGNELSEADAAQVMQVTWREVFGMVRDLHDRTNNLTRPPLILSRMVTEHLPNGRTLDRRVYWMDIERARYVEAADRADLMADVPASAAPDLD